MTSDLRARWTTEIIRTRKGEGLTAAKLTRSDHSILRELQALDHTKGRHARAQRLIELIHDALHANRKEREWRALAHALNLDVAKPWDGSPVAVSTTELLMERRRSFAEVEHISEDGGKPMSDWEQSAASELIDHLGELEPAEAPTPPPQPEREPHADSRVPKASPAREGPSRSLSAKLLAAQPRATRDASDRPHAADRRRRLALIIAAAACAALIAVGAYWAGSRGASDTALDAGPEAPTKDVDQPTKEPTALTEPSPAQPTAAVEPTASPAPAPSPSPAPTATPAPAPTPTATAAPTPTAIPEPKSTPPPTPVPSVIPLIALEPVDGNWDADRTFGGTGFGYGSLPEGQTVLTAYRGRCFYAGGDRSVEYNLAQDFSTFRTSLSMDQRSGSESRFAVWFLVDDAEVPTRRYTIDLFTDDITGIEVDVRGARRLKIVFDAETCVNSDDHAILFPGAALVR